MGGSAWRMMGGRLSSPGTCRQPPAMLGQFIEQKRADLGLTREYLAAQLGVSRPQYRKIESGTRELTLAEAERLAGELGLTLADFQAHRAPRCELPAAKPARRNPRLKIRAPKRDIEKFRQVLMYVLGEIGLRPNVNDAVLHRILYFIDFDYYERHGESLSGVTYIRNHYGPIAVDFRTVVRQQEERGELEVVSVRHCGEAPQKYLLLADPDLSVLSGREIKHIDAVLAQLAHRSSADLARYARGDIPWLAAQPDRPIDYASVFYRDGPCARSIQDDAI